MSGPVIVNHIGPEVSEALKAHPSQPRVLDDFEPKTPGDLPEDVEIVLTRALAEWRQCWEDSDAPAHGLPNLKWVQTFSVGVDRYPPWLLEGRMVTNGRGMTARAIAEFTLAAILLREKPLVKVSATSRDTWDQKAFPGRVNGKTLGIFGYGAIGQEIVKRALAFEMDVVVCRRSAPPADAPAGMRYVTSLDEMIGQCDHLVISTPLTDETREIVNAAMLAKAAKGLHLINVARGALINEADLRGWLDSDPEAFATLDVTWPEPPVEGDPLYTHPQVLLTPHVSWSGDTIMPLFVEKVLKGLDAYVAGQPPEGQVDLKRGY